MIGLAQVIGGALLISFGFVNVGAVLISEGISDMVYATMAGLSGNFSWRDWAIQKTSSLSLSILTLGIGRLASTGNTMAKLGSVSRAAMCTKILGKAALQFAKTFLVNFLTEKIIHLIQESVIEKVVDSIEENLLKGLNILIDKKVEILFANSSNDQEFENLFEEMKKCIEGALKKNILSPQFDQIRLQVVSSLKNNYHQFTDDLRKSNSQYAKLAANVITTAVFVDKLWNLLQTALKFKDAYNSLKDIIETMKKMDENINTNRENPNLVKIRAEQWNQIIREYITNKLTRELDKVLRQLISEVLTQIGKAVAQGAKAIIDSQFNGKNPVETMKESNSNQRSQVSVEQPSSTENSKKEQQDQERRNDLQTTIQNPKKLFDESSKEMKDKNIGLGHSNIRMLADSEWRNTVLHNLDTGETEVIRPSGLRKVFAFFKQPAEINYRAGEIGEIGHYSSARGERTYTQLDGCRNCMVIAYYQLLGHSADEDFIRQKRAELDQYTIQNSKTYQKYQEEIMRSGRDQMIGGGKAEKKPNRQEIPQSSGLRKINIDDPDIKPEQTTKDRRNRKVDTNKIRKEITDQLWPQTFEKLSNKTDRVDIGFTQTKAYTIHETANVRLDDQGPTGERNVVNFQTQYGGKDYCHQRKGTESTTFACVILERPPDSRTTYSYRKEDFRKAHDESLEQGIPIRMGPKKPSDEKKQPPGQQSTSKNSKPNTNQKKK